MKPKVIKTAAQYEATLARIEEIFDAKPGTAKGDELELLVLLVENYEDKAFPFDLPDPITALRFRMEQDGLRPKDLIPFIGNKSKVSEVLSGKRPLSLAMIRKLVAGLHFPAVVALREIQPSPRGPIDDRPGGCKPRTLADGWRIAGRFDRMRKKASSPDSNSERFTSRPAYGIIIDGGQNHADLSNSIQRKRYDPSLHSFVGRGFQAHDAHPRPPCSQTRLHRWR